VVFIWTKSLIRHTTLVYKYYVSKYQKFQKYEFEKIYYLCIKRWGWACFMNHPVFLISYNIKFETSRKRAVRRNLISNRLSCVLMYNIYLLRCCVRGRASEGEKVSDREKEKERYYWLTINALDVMCTVCMGLRQTQPSK